MKKIACIFTLAAVVCGLFSSCDSANIIKPVDSLLSPPLYHEEYEELVEAFRENVSKDGVLCSPQDGDYRSAIIVEDVDSDGETEALIFYKDIVESAVVKMHYFNTVNGDWTSKGDYSGYGNEVKKVVISDMDSDGKCELVVIWGVSGVSSGNIMSVYRTHTEVDEYKEISNETCTVCEVADVDGDSKEEIFYMNQVTVSEQSQRYAKIMKIDGGTVEYIGEAKLDPNISSYISVKTEKASTDSPFRFYIDALKGENQMITELVYWDNKKAELCAPLLNTEEMINKDTLREVPVSSADINNDGVIDIPVQTDVINDSAEVGYLIKWFNYSNGVKRTVATTFVNYNQGYMVQLNEDESIRYLVSQNSWVVSKINFSDQSSYDLYSVVFKSTDNNGSNETNAGIPIIEKEDGVIYAFISQSGVNMGIDEEQVKKIITKIP